VALVGLSFTPLTDVAVHYAFPVAPDLTILLLMHNASWASKLADMLMNVNALRALSACGIALVLR